MKKNISSKEILILSFIIVIAIISTIIPFLINFYSQPISKDITDWASFSSYISGIINTLIALISLIVLSYLTYFVSKQSSSENKNVNLLMRKLDAYESLISFLPIISSSLDNMIWYLKGATKHINDNEREKEYQVYLEKIFESVRNFKEVHFFITSFGDRYSHFFEYDFKSEGYSDLLIKSNEHAEYYDKILEKLFERKIEAPENGEKINEDFLLSLNKFINALKSELDTK